MQPARRANNKIKARRQVPSQNAKGQPTGCTEGQVSKTNQNGRTIARDSVEVMNIVGEQTGNALGLPEGCVRREAAGDGEGPRTGMRCVSPKGGRFTAMVKFMSRARWSIKNG